MALPVVVWGIGAAGSVIGGILGYLKGKYDIFSESPTKTVLTSPFLLVLAVVLAMTVFANFKMFADAIKGTFK